MPPARDARGRLLPATKKINGVTHRCCTGPGHDEPTWLPEIEKYFYLQKRGLRAGKYSARCRLCSNWNKLKSPGLSGTVPVAQVRPYFIEGVHRVGLVEFCRRANLSEECVHDIIGGVTERVQKRTVRKAMLEVISMRRKNEVRNRKSIQVGAYLRGWEEYPVTTARDLYRPFGDNEIEAQKRRRDEMSEEERAEIREKDRQRKRHGRSKKAA